MPTKNILLVEDNADDRELMRLAFAQGEISHNLIVVADGIEALNYLQRQADNQSQTAESGNLSMTTMPALIMLDLNLPRINGIEVLKRIRASSYSKIIPVVIISSSNEPQDLIDSYINGCNSYIRKPIHFTQLQNFVKEISTYWLTVNQLPTVFGVPNE
ncbi:two-component system response regulator [Pleurocapsa sp. CCALA 161]|uniref:response regulator n=1 Tax=Pleurocapsa sp. CCALA 161 TaxID=2107688 RepID=UPI000D063A72|nr:response regulator [Pleurocapsa sp. CCALA 161]PSB11406.1 two-component system response regulator [Pleurocapsa sp. CCALA 161]